MAAEVILPKLGMNVDTATVVRWLKREGESVGVGDALAEVETDKTTIELEAEINGIVRKLFVAEGDRVSVRQTIALIGTADEDISAFLRPTSTVEPAAPAHIDRVYRTWRNGASPEASVADIALAPALTATGSVLSAVRSDRLDPAAIRQRLVERGVLPADSAHRTGRPGFRVVIYGAGLGARQVLEVTRQLADVRVIGLIDDNSALTGSAIAHVPVLGGFERLAELVRESAVDGVALSFHSEVRRRVHRRLAGELGIRLVALVDPRAIIGMDVQIGPGALVEAGAVVGPGTTIGEGAIVDVGAVVAHDCSIGPFSHLSPGCRLSGVVNLTENVLVGVGASLNSTITIGRNVIIAPGAAVMNDVPDDVVVSGVPARVIGQSHRGAR